MEIGSIQRIEDRVAVPGGPESRVTKVSEQADCQINHEVALEGAASDAPRALYGGIVVHFLGEYLSQFERRVELDFLPF
jgi:hypothetical protein